LTETVARAPDVLWRRTFDRVILLGLADREVQTLLGTGVDVWDLLSVARSVESMTEVLSDRYGADADVVRSDVAGLVDRLEAAGAVVRTP
jgi:Coenzyme PQQ synthesis protein D (PqqD)